MTDDTDDLDAPDAPEGPPKETVDRGYRARAWAQAALVTAVSAAVLGYGFSSRAVGPARMLPIIGASYVLLGAGALAFLRGRGELRAQLAPRRLDITAGALVAVGLFIVTNMAAIVILRGRPQESWLWRLLVQLGDPRVVPAVYVGPAILVIATLEEIVWRGWVMNALRVAHGSRTALWLSSLLYGLAHLGTLFTLRTDAAGPNPLVIAAAVFCGMVWGAMALRFERLAPSLFAHAFFSWATALFPLWPRV